ncbi:MAG: S-layer homology domain-containing protein [Cyanobacteria bacterium P01_H01_bin.121]
MSLNRQGGKQPQKQLKQQLKQKRMQQRLQQRLKSILTAAFGSAIATLGSTLGTTSPATAQTMGFSDTRGHWIQQCVANLAELNIASAFPSGLYEPNRPLTRSLYADMLVRAFPNLPAVQGAPMFRDVNAGTLFQDSITQAYQQGFFTGVSTAAFRPNEAITRQDLLVAIANGLKTQPSLSVGETLESTYDDAAAIANYAQPAIAAATEQGFVVNYPNVRELRPAAPATRAEGAAVICQARLAALQETGVPPQYIAELPTIPELVTETQVNEAGNVLAELSYLKENYVYDSLRLKVTRENELILDQTIPREGGFTRALGLRVLDLDGDGESEILVDFFAGRERCCSFSLIYSYLPRRNGYGITEQRWEYADYVLTDLDQDGVPEFKSEDTRFSFRFDEQSLAMSLPVQIWQYRQGQFFDATGLYPQFIEQSADRLWGAYLQRLQTRQNVKGVLAAYVATKYVLGEGEDGFSRVEFQYTGADRSRYLRELREFLRGTGYTTY